MSDRPGIMKEKIPREGEFTLRTDPWAGLIASTGSFYLMVFILLSGYRFLSSIVTSVLAIKNESLLIIPAKIT